MTKKARLSVRIKPESKEFLRKTAASRGRTLTGYLSELLDYHASGKHTELKAKLGVAESRVLLLEAEVRILSRLLDSAGLEKLG